VNSTILRPSGVLAGGSQGTSFRAALAAGIDQIERVLIVDLADVTAVDDEVLRALVGAAAELEQSRHELVIAGARDTVDSLIRLTRVDRKIRSFATTADAEAAVAAN
jgi:anti-anti-sigma regulatory factor